MIRPVSCLCLASLFVGSLLHAAEPPTAWSVVRNENILWRTPLPEGGQSAVTVSGGRAFLTMHRPVEDGDELTEPNLIGLCLDAESGEILWQIDLPGTDPVQMAGIFSDATTFAPVADRSRVWFFNRCGSMGCFDAATGRRIWLRTFLPRPRHTNRQCEPLLVGNLLLTVEVRDKAAGQKLERHQPVPETIDPRDVWTYLHAIDRNTGEVRWIGTEGTSVHNTPRIGQLADGTWAVAHGRGGGHGPLEQPYGVSLTRISDGKTLWSTDLGKCEASFQAHWDRDHVYWWRGKEHLILDTASGNLLRKQNVCESATLASFNGDSGQWSIKTGVSVPAKRMPLTNQTNVVVGDWHYFLAHDIIAIGRVHIPTGRAEYVEVPVQLAAGATGAEDQLLWNRKDAIPNDTRNSRGIDIATDRRAKGSGWGHVSAAMPLPVDRYLYAPVMNGTVYVIDTEAETPETLLVAVNDLGPAGETWTLSPFTESEGRLYTRTMKEVICIGRKKAKSDSPGFR